MQASILFTTLTRLLLFVVLLVIQAETQVVWSNHPDIQSAQVTVYPGGSLIIAETPQVSFTQAFALSTTGTPVAGAIGITTFEIPQTHYFALITNKSITSSSFTFKLQVSDESAFYKLKMAYIVMMNSGPVFRLLSHCSLNISLEFYCSTINQGKGFRSEYDIISPSTASDSYFTTTDIQSKLVIEGLRLINTARTYTFLGNSVNIPRGGTINTTFYTYEENQVHFIQYSVLFYKPNVAYQTMREIFELGITEFSSNSSLSNQFFSNIDSRYTAAAGRMFFGLRQFNFTYLDNKYFGLDLNNYANLATGYIYSSSMAKVRMSYYFFVERTCSGSTYFYKDPSNPSNDACFASCSGFGDRPVADNLNKMCLACHYSCLTCSGTITNCLTCQASMNRHISGATCPCDSGYADNGVSQCAQCSDLMVGCLTCSSSSTCTSCRSGFTGTVFCSCSTGSIVSGYCNSVYGCTSISEITGSPLCTSCNQSLYIVLAANFTCVCITGTITQANNSCLIICGDAYVLPQQGCDDGNLINGDGCSSTCKVEKNWLCIGTYAQGSICKISTVPNLQYVGIQRITSQNTARMYFTLTPYFKEYTYINFSGLMSTNMQNTGFEVTFKTDQMFLVATIHYIQDIQDTYQSFIVLLNNTSYFWNASDWSSFKLKGVNCELTYDSALWMHNTLKYIYLAEIIIAIIVFIASIFYEKWIGLQLIQTFQSIFFCFALLKDCPFEFTGIVQSFKYANGYDDLLPSDYYRVYSLSNHLNILSVQKQFLSNYNVMYLLAVCVIIVMVVIGIAKRKYRQQLQEQISKKIADKLTKLDRLNSFVFGKIFLMLMFFSLFKIIFSFCVQLSSQTTPHRNFHDQLNVAFGIFAFILLFSTISFVLYWFLLLPNNFSEQQEFMSIKFQNMSFYYPVLYLIYQVIFILAIAIAYLQANASQIIISLQIIYLLLLVYLRPYNTLRNLNRLLHNVAIIFNQAFVIAFVAITIRWNQIIENGYRNKSNQELTIYAFLILSFGAIVIVLAITRLVTFNKDISFKCFKKQQIETIDLLEEIDYGHMKRMVQSDKQKLKDNPVPENALASLNLDRQFVTLTRKKTKTEQYPQLDNENVDKYLKLINWNHQSQVNDNRPKVTRSKIKVSTAKKAQLVKTPIQRYFERQKQLKQAEQKKMQQG